MKQDETSGLANFIQSKGRCAGFNLFKLIRVSLGFQSWNPTKEPPGVLGPTAENM